MALACSQACCCRERLQHRFLSKPLLAVHAPHLRFAMRWVREMQVHGTWQRVPTRGKWFSRYPATGAMLGRAMRMGTHPTGGFPFRGPKPGLIFPHSLSHQRVQTLAREWANENLVIANPLFYRQAMAATGVSRRGHCSIKLP